MRPQPITLIFLAALAASPLRAECYADYKAKRDDPLRFHYGVVAVPDDACGERKKVAAALERRLSPDGWTLIKILGFFGPEGLNERKDSAGDYFLRY